MRASLLISAYFLFSGLLGSLLAYPVSRFWDTEFERIVSRSILVCAVIILYFACKRLGKACISNATNPSFSYKPLHKIFYGWLLGLAMLLPVIIVQLGYGYRYPDPEITSFVPELLTSLFVALFAGFIIASIEESLFRGVFYQLLQRSTTLPMTLIITSVLYSSVHFLEPGTQNLITNPQWYSGFIVVLNALENLHTILYNLDAFTALFFAGLFLILVRVRTGDLYMCIGIHAGWVTIIKTFKSMTDRNNSADHIWWYASNYDHITSHFTSLIMVTAISYLLWQSSKSAQLARATSS